MQWRRQRRVTHVIGSSNHVLLLARYQDAPPGEEDEEEGLRNGYVEGQDNDSGTHSFSRNVRGGYKPRRTGSNDGGGTRHKDESSGSPSKPKFIFNEDEYTRITTPRQDMLFKKGYLSRKKPWTGNANTSATSSTTESQSASHSTAGRDGSETTEDQQLLDRDCGTTEYSPMMNSGAQLNYETFYNQVGSFYFSECPAMFVVGPAPMHPAHVAPSVLAAVPCGPVPLRPIEWINPIVPKLPDQSYCMMNYEANQESAVVMEEEENIISPFENSNGTCNESGTGSASCNGSVAGETEEQPVEVNDMNKEQQVEEQAEEQLEEQYGDEQLVDAQYEVQPMENGMNGGPYYEPMMMQQPVHMSHVISAVATPYMYPGQYMFGPSFINVNGVTIQSGPMIRTTDVTAMSPACAKRRKKKKKRKQRRLATGNTEDEEEGEYSSEYDTGLPSSRLSWTACPTSTTTSQRPLNPECQEFQLRQTVEQDTSLPVAQTSANNTPTSNKSSTMNQSSTVSSVDNEASEACNGVSSDETKNGNGELSENANSEQQAASTSTSTSTEGDQSKSLDASTNSDDQANRLTGRPRDDETEAPSTNEAAQDAVETEKLPSTTKSANSDSPSANEFCERPSNEMNGEALVNGQRESSTSNVESATKTSTSRPPSPPACNDDRTRSRSATPKSAETTITREDQSHESSLPSSKSSSSSSTCLSKRKYSAKGAKFVREPTPGPDLTDNSATEVENESKLNDLSQSLKDVDLSNDSKPESTLEPCEDEATQNDQSSMFAPEPTVCNHLSKEDAIEALNEDSGFESQTRLSDYPITQAVTEWLRREKSPDLFKTAISMDCEEDEDEMDEEPPKNLQGNPMPALSVNSSADNAELSRAASCGEFARASNNKCGQEQQQQQQQPESNGGNVLRKKKDAKRRSEERRRVARHVADVTLDHDVVSSSDSCGQQEDMVNVARRKNSARQQQQQQQQQQQDIVGDICEFTDTDSVAGMRVALSSRMDSKRVNARRTKRQGRTHARDPAVNIDTKIRRIEDVDDENDEGIVEDTMNVKTFEKGEIVVSEDGKLLTTTVYDPGLRNRHDAAATVTKAATTNKSEPDKQSIERKVEKEKRSSSDEEAESGSAIGSLDSIEEPDVLECWEAEIIEPVITPKRMLQSEGILCDGEATEDDVMEVDQVNMEYVQKYYRLARESATSIEEISLKADPSTSSKSVPNKSEQREEIPAEVEQAGDKSNIPIDEAFEVYESCYNGSSPFLAFDSKVFKSRTLYGQDGETPQVPCKAVCCRIQ
ncbi:unnamed protein product [Xylocopa violacea]|uniref:Serine-rich adhesin for platelets n=1 Tax=Xylocopa violacea TaxID=135666 RepID=A0ABP1NCJ8_XYLVO